MNIQNINTYFYTSAVIGLLVGTILLILWAKKMINKIKTSDQKKGITSGANGIRLPVYMIPGMLVFFVCMIPAFYFQGQQKQFWICQKTIQINKLKKDDLYVNDDCGVFNVDELYR